MNGWDGRAKTKFPWLGGYWRWATNGSGFRLAVAVGLPVLLPIVVLAALFANTQDNPQAAAVPSATRVSDLAAVQATPVPTATNVPAPPTPAPTAVPVPLEYTVQPGDSLIAICASQVPELAVDDCVAETVQRNGMDSADQLAIGQVLVLPMLGVAPPPADSSAPVSAAAPGLREYTVQSGDSLTAICIEQVPELPPDECVSAIVDLNGLAGADQIAIDQVLLLPGAVAAPPPADAGAPVVEGSPSPGAYTVKAGDSLGAICTAQVPAMSTAECVAAVVELNGLSGPDQIAVGQVLVLPGGSTAPPTTAAGQPPTPTPTVAAGQSATAAA